MFDDFHSVALGPNLQLFDGCGTKSVRGAEHHFKILLSQPISKLANAGGFSCSVHADDKNYAWFAVTIGRAEHSFGAIGRLQDAGNMRFDFAFELRGVGECVALQLASDRVQNLARCLYAEVRRKQRGLEMLERCWINLLLPQENIVDRFSERSLGLRDRSLQPLE